MHKLSEKKYQNTNRILSVILALLTLFCSLCVFSGCNNETRYVTSLDQLNDGSYTIMVNTGSGADGDCTREFPKANKTYSYSEADGYLAVREGRADAFMYGKQNIQYAIDTRYNDLKILEGRFLGKSQIAVGVNPSKPELANTINTFLTTLKTERINEISKESVLENMQRRWVFEGDENMPEIPLPTNPTETLRVGTAGFVKPMTYNNGNGLIGFDIEFCQRLAHYMNVKIEFYLATFDELVLGLKTDRFDIVASNLNVTPERQESIIFSNPYIEMETAVVVKKNPKDRQVITSLEQLSDKTIGLVEGSSYTKRVTTMYPNARIVEYKSYAELIIAVKNKRIDAYIIDEPIANIQAREAGSLNILHPIVTRDSYAFMINKTKTELYDEINNCIRELKTQGVLNQLEEKWINSPNNPVMKKPNTWKITKPKKLYIGLTPDSPPFVYYLNNEYAGYDIELMYTIAERLGYEVEINVSDFNALINTLVADTNDVVIGCITVTEERKQNVLFTDDVYQSGSVAVVLADTTSGNFFDNLSNSFNRTFVKEHRWKMIASGLLITLELALLTLLFGTALGFGFSFLLRSNNKVVAKTAEIISIVLDGLPILIILMVLFYIVLAKTPLSAVTIGVIGLSLDFANAVAGILNTGILAVDKGQIEAATSMGYSKWSIFFKIILPQVINQMFDQYTSAIIAMIKGTSIVGYITVIDLTKASDIIRSTTYEAFFPLIASAIIYFVIARIFVVLLNLLAKKLNPKHRKRMIKGVKTND